MKKIGSLLLVFGVAAIVLDFAGYVPRLLFWIYSWGEGVAWAIKIALIIVGAALYFLSKDTEEDQKEDQTESEA